MLLRQWDKVRLRRALRAWENMSMRAKCLHFVARIVDDARMRKALDCLYDYAVDADDKVWRFSERRHYHCQRQAFCALRRWLLKRKHNYSVG